MRKVILSIIAVVLTIFGLSSIAMVSPASAYNCLDGTHQDNMQDCPEWNPQKTGLKTTANIQDTATTIVSWIIAIIGFLSVVMIIIGGFNYTISQGDSNKVKKAKDTIIYGVIGLVIALLAFAIVNLVLTNLFSTGS